MRCSYVVIAPSTFCPLTTMRGSSYCACHHKLTHREPDPHAGDMKHYRTLKPSYDANYNAAYRAHNKQNQRPWRGK